MQNYRAIMALTALTGSYDRVGGQIPAPFTFVHQACGYHTRDHDFFEQVRPKDAKPSIGAQRFPLWYELEREMQSVDLPRQILEGTPYPVRAVFALGMNLRMLPETDQVKLALKKLDFFVDVDLFLTDTAKYADIVLPACSSFERGEFKGYPGGYAFYTNPVIEPLYESKNDVQILSELAAYLELDDDLLRAGYEVGMRWMLEGLSVTVEQLQQSEYPVLVPEAKAFEERAYSRAGYHTPSGKFELESQLILANPQWGLDALPTYKKPDRKSTRLNSSH